MAANVIKFKRLPYSWYSAVPISLAFLGLLLASIGSFSCNLFTASYGSRRELFLSDDWGYIDPNDYDIDIPSINYDYDDYDIDIPSINYGSYSSNFGYGSCVSDYLRDSALKAGYAFGILATIFGVFTLIAVILTTIMTFPKRMFWGMAASSWVIAFCTILAVSVGFATKACNYTTCIPGPAWYAALIGWLLWICAGVSLLFMKKKECTESAVYAVQVIKMMDTPTAAAAAAAAEPMTEEAIVMSPDDTNTINAAVTTSCTDETTTTEALSKTPPGPEATRSRQDDSDNMLECGLHQ